MMAVGWSGTDLLLQGLDFIDGTIKKSPAISFWPNMAEIKQFCQGKWSKIPSKWCKRLLPAIRNAWWPLLLPRVTQLVIRFRGSNYFFTETHTGLDLPGLSLFNSKCVRWWEVALKKANRSNILGSKYFFTVYFKDHLCHWELYNAHIIVLFDGFDWPLWTFP